MKFQQIIFALNRIIQFLISLEYTLFNVIPRSLITLKSLNRDAKECACNLQSCSKGCPKNKPISELNQKLQRLSYVLGDIAPEISGFDEALDIIEDNEMVKTILKEAFEIQVRNTPFIGFTGKICPAPCQDSCTNSLSNDGNGKPVQIKKIEDLLFEIGRKYNWFDDLFINAVLFCINFSDVI